MGSHRGFDDLLTGFSVKDAGKGMKAFNLTVLFFRTEHRGYFCVSGESWRMGCVAIFKKNLKPKILSLHGERVPCPKRENAMIWKMGFASMGLRESRSLNPFIMKRT